MRACLMLLPFVAASAYAANVSVHVSDTAQDNPVAGAAVCLGTSADPSQFGAHRTGSDGAARFSSVPEAPLVLTVSRSGYRGLRRMLPAEHPDRTVLLNLIRGGGGPVCQVSAASEEQVPAGSAAPAIDACVLNGGSSQTANRQVTLRCTVRGQASHYRVSEHSDFRDADWLSYEGDPRYELSAGKGWKTVYVQMRRQRTVAGGSLQSTSNVASADIYLDSP